MRKIEHIGIAVSDLEKSNELFHKLLGKSHFKTEMVQGEGVETSFFQVGETKVELLQATRPDSPIAKYLERKSEGIHHIAFDVEDIHDPTVNSRMTGLITAEDYDLFVQAVVEGALENNVPESIIGEFGALLNSEGLRDAIIQA